MTNVCSFWASCQQHVFLKIKELVWKWNSTCEQQRERLREQTVRAPLPKVMWRRCLDWSRRTAWEQSALNCYHHRNVYWWDHLKDYFQRNRVSGLQQVQPTVCALNTAVALYSDKHILFILSLFFYGHSIPSGLCPPPSLCLMLHTSCLCALVPCLSHIFCSHIQTFISPV